jgi:hypothetical protein
MTVTVIQNSPLPKRFGPARVDATTKGGVIYCEGWWATLLISTKIHELQHVKQQTHDGWWWTVRYTAEYWAGRARLLSAEEAYLNVSYEREARAMEQKYATTEAWSKGEGFPFTLNLIVSLAK